jgi:hypothetical protein
LRERYFRAAPTYASDIFMAIAAEMRTAVVEITWTRAM